MFSLPHTFVGQDNGSNLVQNHKPEALQKVKAIRAMSTQEVLKLTISPNSHFNANKTVARIIEDTFSQTKTYVRDLQCKPENNHVRAYFMHICVAVGSGKIVYKTLQYTQ